MKFRLTSLLWAFALSASALATFGGTGIVVSAIVIGLWAVFFIETRRDSAAWLTAMLVAFLLLALLAPAVQSARETSRRLNCINNLKQLSLALLNYESARGEYPAASQSGPNKQHLHSWRYWITPYLESTTFYDQYDPNRAWDDPNNSKLIAKTVPMHVYTCPSHDSQNLSTHYFAVVGDNTAWPQDRGRTFREITDGMSNTILLIEAPHKSVPWAKPEDLSFEEAVELLTNPPQDQYFGHEVDEGFFFEPSQGINVAFCDGRVELLPLPVQKEYAVAMLTANGGEELSTLEMWQARNPELDYGRIYGLCMFLALSLAPLLKLRHSLPEMVDPADIEVLEDKPR